MHKANILAELDSIRPTSCCSGLPPACYCPAYVGPHYGDKTKILFIALDAGTSDGVENPMTAKEWQSSIFIGGYREKQLGKSNPWNAHYRGCIKTASAILKIPCESECDVACRIKAPSECALAYFAQTNVVKCVPPKKGMRFEAEDRIARCMPLHVFREIEPLQPDVIILQGRNRGTGHIQEDFQREIVTGQWGTLAMDDGDLVGTITWTRGLMAERKTVLASFAHPSARGKSNLKNSWTQQVVPSIPKIHALLEQYS
jgi:hypothetical protein